MIRAETCQPRRFLLSSGTSEAAVAQLALPLFLEFEHFGCVAFAEGDHACGIEMPAVHGLESC